MHTEGITMSNNPAKVRDLGTKPNKQPYPYKYNSDFQEPDWTRLPGYKNVTKEEWRSVLWQKRGLVKNLQQLKTVMGDYLTDAMATDILKDQAERATMSMLVPPQMINTM